MIPAPCVLPIHMLIPPQLQRYRDSGVSTNAAPCRHTLSSVTSNAESWQCLKGDYGFISSDDEEADIGGAEQSIDEERVAYLTSPRAPKGTNLLDFWAVSFYFSHARYDILMLVLYRQVNMHNYPTWFKIAMDYLPIQASAVPCERVFSSSAQTDTRRRNRIKPELMEALQMLKYALKKARLDFTGMWVTDEEALEQLGEDSVEQDLLAMELR